MPMQAHRAAITDKPGAHDRTYLVKHVIEAGRINPE